MDPRSHNNYYIQLPIFLFVCHGILYRPVIAEKWRRDIVCARVHGALSCNDMKASSLKSRFAAKMKAAVRRYKRCRYWLSRGLRRTAGRGDRTKIDDVFDELNRDRDSLVERLNDGQELYPNCDTSIWLRSCTHEIPNPIQGTVRGNNSRVIKCSPVPSIVRGVRCSPLFSIFALL